MPVALRPARVLEPVLWPTGEEVPVKRPNAYSAEYWDTVVIPAIEAGDPKAIRAGLVAFVAMVCPAKTEQQIRDECDDDFLWLAANYSRERLEAAQAFLVELAGKTMGAAVPAPDAPTGTSPDGSPAPTGVPCGA